MPTERQLKAAAAKWRAKQAETTDARDRLIALVAQASEDGDSERHLAETLGVTRMTVRAWLGRQGY